jgi:MFS family permease
MRTTLSRPSGLFAFTLVWLGQLVSVLATQMTHFALTIWVYQKTGSVTALGAMQVFTLIPYLLITPVAGVMVDRYNRKLMMMVSDLGAGLATLTLLGLQAAGALQLWHLYAAAAVTGLGAAFQWPAYSAAISTMLPKAHYGRANGMMSLVELGPGVVAPLLAGALLPFIALTGIMTIDVITFVFAILVLLSVRIPQPPRTETGAPARGGLLREAGFGFRYVAARPSLVGLQLVFLFGNLFLGMAGTVLAPMVLARTQQNAVALGSVQSASALAAVAGGLLMSLWGGFRRRVHGVLLGWMLASLLGLTVVGLGRSVAAWMIGAALFMIFVPLIDGSNQAIWQAKVPPDVQGRVFSARAIIGGLAQPVAPLLAGPLADFVLEPAMRANGSLSGVFGGLVGVGPGAGMALIFILCGMCGALTGALGYLVPAVRRVEDRLPDHDVAPASPAEVSAPIAASD